MPQRIRVMVVDDEALVRRCYTRLLEREGFDVVEHPGSIGFAVALHQHQPDVVLLDLELDGRAGEQALRDAIVACGSELDVRPRVVVVSGLPDDVRAERARALGANATLSKNQPIADVVAACRRCE